MIRTLVAAALVMAIPSTTAASLGGMVTTVEVDRAQMKAAQLRIIRGSAYSFHELQAPTGVTIREYYAGTTGAIFGVAWEGPWPPDLRQLLGSYFDQFQRANLAAKASRHARTRGLLVVNDGGLVVQIMGHARWSSGFAYAPQLLPAGVQPGIVR